MQAIHALDCRTKISDFEVFFGTFTMIILRHVEKHVLTCFQKLCKIFGKMGDKNLVSPNFLNSEKIIELFCFY